MLEFNFSDYAKAAFVLSLPLVLVVWLLSWGFCFAKRSDEYEIKWWYLMLFLNIVVIFTATLLITTMVTEYYPLLSSAKFGEVLLAVYLGLFLLLAFIGNCLSAKAIVFQYRDIDMHIRHRPLFRLISMSTLLIFLLICALGIFVFINTLRNGHSFWLGMVFSIPCVVLSIRGIMFLINGLENPPALRQILDRLGSKSDDSQEK